MGQLFTFKRKNGGSKNHLLSFFKPSGENLVASSAGLSAVGTQFHSLASVSSLISAMRFDMKILFMQGSDFIHCKTVYESDQNTRLSILKSCSAKTVFAMRTPRTDACSSNRGIVVGFKGATRLLDKIIEV